MEKHALDATDVATIVRWLDEHEDIVACIGEEDYVYFNHSNDQMRRTWASLGKTAPDVFFDDPHVRTAEHETFQMSPYIVVTRKPSCCRCYRTHVACAGILISLI